MGLLYLQFCTDFYASAIIVLLMAQGKSHDGQRKDLNVPWLNKVPEHLPQKIKQWSNFAASATSTATLPQERWGHATLFIAEKQPLCSAVVFTNDRVSVKEQPEGGG